MKFTFKTNNPTGAYRSFHPSSHYIKLKKINVGSITDRTWEIRLMAVKSDINEDGNPNCEWKWIKLSRVSKSLQEAKDWLNENFEAINNKYKLYQIK